MEHLIMEVKGGDMFDMLGGGGQGVASNDTYQRAKTLDHLEAAEGRVAER